MITKDHELSISAQARLLNISRSTTYYTPRPPSAQDLTLMRQLDELHLKHPTIGSRMLRDQLNRMGVSRWSLSCEYVNEKNGDDARILPTSDEYQASWPSDLSLPLAGYGH